MNSEFFRNIDNFVSSTSKDIDLRHDDSIVIVKPGRSRHLDSAGFEIVKSLYEEKSGAQKTVELIHKKFGTEKNIIVKDLSDIIQSLTSLMDNDKDIHIIKYKTESKSYYSDAEISLTYSCQNSCEFCSVSGLRRRKELNEISTEQAKLIIDRLRTEADFQSISFTGGEPTLRKDLYEIIEYAAKKGMDTRLVTNGIKCADADTVKKLSGSGLNSAMVRLESDDELTHNRITGNIESYTKTVAGIHNLISSGIYTYTGTTICRCNRDHLIRLVEFAKKEWNAESLLIKMSMTERIPDDEGREISFTSISGILAPVIKRCKELDINLIWGSSTPYCMFNPADHNLKSRPCSCLSGILSVNPSGDVTPCYSHTRIIGSLLDQSFDDILKSSRAEYFMENKYTPGVCSKCGMKTLCRGGCPLYWEKSGSFKEIKMTSKKKHLFSGIFRTAGKREKSK